MRAGGVTAEMIADLRQIMKGLEGPMQERHETQFRQQVVSDILDNLEASRAEVAALRRQVERRESPDWVTVREKWWTVAQILANAWRRHPLTCSERDKLLTEWDALRSGEAGNGAGPHSEGGE